MGANAKSGDQGEGFVLTKLRSIDIERSTPKFLKNWEIQLFQKLVGVGSRRLI